MKSFLKTLLAVVIANLLLLLIVIGVIANRVKQPVEVKEGSVLVQTLEGDLPEWEMSGGMPFPGGGAMTHAAVLENLEKARHDKKIKAVLLRLNEPVIGMGKSDELRARIRALREAGKPVWAYTDFLSRRSLYLGSACDSLFMLPTGYAMLHGVAAERMFLAGTLEKLGIRENLHRIEGYKAAAEMLQRRDMSPPSRANLEWILDETYPAYLRTVEEGRRLAAGSFEPMVLAQGSVSPQQAREAGLVDRLLYWDEVEAALLRVPGVKTQEKKKIDKRSAEGPRLIQGGEYARVERKEAGIKGKKTIAIVHASGSIAGEQSGFSLLGDAMGSASMEEAFRQAAQDKDAVGILYRVDSGGGESHTSWRIQRAALRAQEVKPIVVSMVDVAGSGGYLICYPLKPIYAGPLSIVGSIGSISGKMNMKGLYDKLGVTKDVVTRGPFATMQSDYADYTAAEWEVFRRQHWSDYNEWVDDIARARGRTFAEIDSVGRGRVWTGAQALQKGLIDEVGTFDDALAALKEKVGIPATEEVAFVHYPKKKGALEALKSGGLAAAIVAMVDSWVAPLRSRAVWAIDPNDYR